MRHPVDKPEKLATDAKRLSAQPEHLWELTLTEASALVRQRQITSRKLVEAWLSRIADFSQLNAFISVDAAAALKQADSYDHYLEAGGDPLPLGGVPIAIKDNIQVIGFANTAGTPALSKFFPTRNARVIEPLLKAGAIVVGKTNMHELAFGTSGYNTAFHSPGVIGVRNAFDHSCIAGGSSSGSGSAVGALLIPAALGTDTGGSVRQPGAVNGCVGFRPTVGRYPVDGITPISPTRDTPGPIARSIEDIVLLDSIITGALPAEAPAAESIRLGVVDQLWADLSDPVRRLSEDALRKLEQQGVQIVRVPMPEIFEMNHAVSMPLALHECRSALTEYLSANEAGVSFDELVAGISSPDVRTIFEDYILPGRLGELEGQPVDLEQAYVTAMKDARPKLIQSFELLFKEHQLDAIIHPTTPDLAIKSNPAATSFEAFARMIRNADPASNAGMPGISLPAGLSQQESLPVGIEIEGIPGSDVRLLSIAKLIESILGRGPTPKRSGS